MNRVTRRRHGNIDADFEDYSDGERETDFFLDASHRARAGRSSHKHKAAWQRVDDRREYEQLRAELADWEDWDVSVDDERFGAPDPR